MVSNDEAPVTDTEVHYLQSEQVGDEFKIVIGHCGSSESASRPVLFLGDPSLLFGTAVEMIRLLHFYERLPAHLVVGIGYRVANLDVVGDLRCRDFTPTVDSIRYPNDDPAMMGGAARFLAFIRDDLKPWVRERYGVDPDDSTFFGDSLGGLFGTYVLLSEPATFRRYGIGSPTYSWDNEMMFGHEAEFARTHDDLAANVFVSVGANETPEGGKRLQEQLPPEAKAKAEAEAAADPPSDYVANCDRMVTLLRGRAYPSLDIGFEVLPGEYHETAPALNLSRSLRYLFGTPR
jgi:uncharacterized protein